jgi:hypothetical protein
MKKIVSRKTDKQWCNQIDKARANAARSYYEIGEAFFHLQTNGYSEWKKDPELSEEDRETFTKDDYYKWRWDYSQRSVSQFVKAYEVVEKISSAMALQLPIPTSERVARGLTKLLIYPDRLVKVWQLAVSKANGKSPTCRHVEMAIEEEQKPLRIAAKKKAKTILEEKKKLIAKQKLTRKEIDDSIIETSLEDLDDNDEDFNEMLVKPLEEIEQEELEDLELSEEDEEQLTIRELISDVAAAKIAEKVWEAIYRNRTLYRQESLLVARCTIKMLFKKFPQLMDEPIETK